MMEPYLKPYGWQYVGANWGGSDFLHPESNVRLEVKQSAAQQAWRSKPSRGSFDIAPRTGYYRVDTPGRCSQLYVFAWNGSYDPDGETHTTDHRDHAQWEFYVVPTKSLDQHHPEQKKIALSVIKKLAQLVDVAGLGSEIDRLRRRLDG